MASVAELTIKVLADTAKAQAELAKTTDSVSGTQKALGKMAAPAALALTGIVAFGTQAVKSASETEQAFGALESVFGKSAGAAKKNANAAADSLGLAASQYGNLAAVLGSQLKNMGTASDQLAPKTDNLIKLGADLAATYGGTTAEAVEAISSLLRGERDPIEKYGVSMNQAAIDAQKMAMGTNKATGAAKSQADQQAALAILMKQTTAAQGQSAREYDTVAASTARATANYENMKSTLGQALLPAVASVLGVFAELGKFLSQHTTTTQVLIGVIAGLAAAILVANAALKAMALAEKLLGVATAETTGKTVAARAATIAKTIAEKAAAVATKAWAAAQWLINAALSANPIGIVIALVAALVAGLIVAYRQSETFRRIVDAAFDAVLAAAKACWNWIKANWPLLLAVLTGPIGAAVLVIARNWDHIKDGAQSVIGWLRGAWGAIQGILTAPFTAAWSTISGIISQIRGAVASISSAIKSIPKPKIPDLNPFSAPAGYTAPTQTTYRGVAKAPTVRATTQGGTTINITAIDPESAARAVARVLTQHGIRTGRLSTISTAQAI